jgi:hypothetical protein
VARRRFRGGVRHARVEAHPQRREELPHHLRCDRRHRRHHLPPLLLRRQLYAAHAHHALG